MTTLDTTITPISHAYHSVDISLNIVSTVHPPSHGIVPPRSRRDTGGVCSSESSTWLSCSSVLPRYSPAYISRTMIRTHTLPVLSTFSSMPYRIHPLPTPIMSVKYSRTVSILQIITTMKCKNITLLLWAMATPMIQR